MVRTSFGRLDFLGPDEHGPANGRQDSNKDKCKNDLQQAVPSAGIYAQRVGPAKASSHDELRGEAVFALAVLSRASGNNTLQSCATGGAMFCSGDANQ